VSDYQLDHERATPLRRQPDAEGLTHDSGTAPHPLLALQRQVGNAQIARMLAQREGAPEEEEMVQATHDPALLQREGAPEEEEMVQATHDPALLQREGAPEEEEMVQATHDPALLQREGAPEEEEMVQASPEVGLEGGPVSGQLADRINSQRGGGSALDAGTRSSMEGAFGTSFEDVRVHNDNESHQLNRSISAKAFTTGNDIFLGQNASAGDQNLMAHELTHVVQQRSMSHSGPMSVGPAGDSYEQQADATAATINSGAAPVQRHADEEHE
jgi:hypothetical protein